MVVVILKHPVLQEVLLLKLIKRLELCLPCQWHPPLVCSSNDIAIPSVVCTLLSDSTFFYIDARPSLAKLSVLRTAKGKKIQIIKRLAPNWRNVGILLDFDQSGTELDIIEKTHPTDLIACSQAMFQHWLKGNGLTPCSWRTLIEVLGDCDQQALAKEIQDAIAS